jgi:hypothetical protein
MHLSNTDRHDTAYNFYRYTFYQLKLQEESTNFLFILT